jgi:hypothetical protein
VSLVDLQDITFCSDIGEDVSYVGDGATERSAISTAAGDHKNPGYLGDTAVVRSLTSGSVHECCNF